MRAKPSDKSIDSIALTNDMKSRLSFAIVLVTAPNLKVARSLVTRALKAKLVACANVIRGVESHYWWQGRIDTGREVLIVFKTRKPMLPALEKFILANHPYDTPEFVVLPITGGSPRYLDWISASLR